MPTSVYVAQTGRANEEPVKDGRPLLAWTPHPALAGEFILLLRKGGLRVAPIFDIGIALLYRCPWQGHERLTIIRG